MTAKIFKFPEQTELQKARSRMGGDEELYQGFRQSLADAAEDADFKPVDPEQLAEVLADFED